jgi:phage tail protein X
MLVERESNSPVLVEQRLGAGRTILCGIDQTWRWRLRVGETDQDRFWLQLVRYAAGDTFTSRTDKGWLDAEPVTAEPGQAVRVRVKLPDAAADAAAPTVELWKGDEHVADRVLSQGIGAGEFSGSITAPAMTALEQDAGDEVDYTLRLKGTDAAMPLHVWRNYQAELANLSASDEPMRRMAESSGGALLTLDQVSSLPQRIEAARSRVAQFVEVRLWDSVYLYLFVVACLSGEWAIRKIVGLV